MTRRSVSFLFMGDANAKAESRSANSEKNFEADILKVGHHGSATSSQTLHQSLHLDARREHNRVLKYSRYRLNTATPEIICPKRDQRQILKAFNS
ncbi:MAG: hypothetical protein NTV68_05630 [Methanomicrobiales archaeon]|nr:hypothetical protein [Methanomicrobiales archaeon]